MILKITYHSLLGMQSQYVKDEVLQELYHESPNLNEHVVKKKKFPFCNPLGMLEFQ